MYSNLEIMFSILLSPGGIQITIPGNNQSTITFERGEQRAPLLSARCGNEGVDNAVMAVAAREEEEDYLMTTKQ